MGLFLDLAAVHAREDMVRQALSSLSLDGRVHSAKPDRTLVFFPKPTGNFRRIRDLSRDLHSSVFACHIHDGDLWMYELYVAGELTDKFNALPSYWKELSAAEEAEWKGKADVLTKHWTPLKTEEIHHYLVNRRTDVADRSAKAYPEDVYCHHDCWQLTDFLRKLGTPYPSNAQDWPSPPIPRVETNDPVELERRRAIREQIALACATLFPTAPP